MGLKEVDKGTMHTVNTTVIYFPERNNMTREKICTNMYFTQFSMGARALHEDLHNNACSNLI
jgi:hypothetical protein